MDGLPVMRPALSPPPLRQGGGLKEAGRRQLWRPGPPALADSLPSPVDIKRFV